jgi:pimeloyl-ACP methyl ester carboxylesterase
LCEELPQDWNVLRPDLPGHGNSGEPPLESIEAMATWVAELIDDQGLAEPVVALGHSMGGAVALSLALNHPTRVAALVMVSSGAKLRVAQPMLQAVRDQFDQVTRLMGRAVFAEATPVETVRHVLGSLFDAPRQTVLADLEACNSFDVEARLDELTLPVELITGKEDILTPPRLARRLAARVPTANLTVIDGAGHMLPQEQPRTLVSRLKAITIEKARPLAIMNTLDIESDE